jgi:hypothetical protein
MRYRKPLPIWRRTALAGICALTALVGPYTAGAFMIQDGDFSTSPGGSAGGPLVFGSDTETVGPWTLSSSGIVIVPSVLQLAAPSVSVNDGGSPLVGRIGGLASLGLGDNNSASISQVTGYTFIEGHTYTFSTQVSSGSALSLGLLSLNNSGVGIAITGNGTDVANSRTESNPLLVNLSLLSGSEDTYVLSLSYTATSVTAGQTIGVRLFAGEGSNLASASILSNTIFDNATLIPETNSGVLILSALGGIMLLRRHQRRA